MTENLIPVLKTGHPIGRKDNKPMELTWHIMKTMKTMGSRHSSCTSSGSTPVCLPVPTWSWEHHPLPAQPYLHPPGQAIQHFENHVIFTSSVPSTPSGLLWVIPPNLTTCPVVDHSMFTCIGQRSQQQRTPQRKILSPFIFTLYTAECSYWTESWRLGKFSDESAVMGCIREDDREE